MRQLLRLLGKYIQLRNQMKINVEHRRNTLAKVSLTPALQVTHKESRKNIIAPSEPKMPEIMIKLAREARRREAKVNEKKCGIEMVHRGRNGGKGV